MAPFFANRSCDPFTGKESRCIIGAYDWYAVMVKSSGDVSKALMFAKRNNIRITIRNTGHDYNGKSSGAGSLGIWHITSKISQSLITRQYITQARS